VTPLPPPTHTHPLSPRMTHMQATALRTERDQLQAACDAHETEALVMQGQLRLLQQQACDEENWLVSPAYDFH
jgi:hypothetical protein